MKIAYGFEFENRGCVADSILIGKAKKYNERVIEHLNKCNGNKWFDKHQRQVDSLIESVNHAEVPNN